MLLLGKVVMTYRYIVLSAMDQKKNWLTALLNINNVLTVMMLEFAVNHVSLFM